MAVPGETKCREVSPCGTGPWGSIPVDATTIYVDASYDTTVGPSDGTKAHPFKTVQAGADAAGSGAVVAIAAGKYLENVRLAKPVRLIGVCPSAVALEAATEEPALVVSSGASGSSVRALSVTGKGEGIRALGANFTIDRVRVHDTGRYGVVAAGSKTTEVTLTGSLVEQASAAGVTGATAKVTVDKSVIRDTRPHTDGNYGQGIYVDQRATLLVRGSLVERNHEAGLEVFGANVTVEGSVVRGTKARVTGLIGGDGIFSAFDRGVRANVVVRGSLIEKNESSGLLLIGIDAIVEDTVVRDNQPSPRDRTFGQGIILRDQKVTKARTVLQLRRSVVERNFEVGVFLDGSEATIEQTIVRETKSQLASGTLGSGIYAQDNFATKQPAKLVVRGALVEKNRGNGVAGAGSDVTVEGSVVRDNEPQTKDQKFGTGITIIGSADTGAAGVLIVRGTFVRGNREVGVLAGGATALIEGCVVEDTGPRVSDKAAGVGVYAYDSPDTKVRAQMTVRGSLVQRNHEGGIVGFGADLVVEDTVVRDTLPTVRDGMFGGGIHGGVNPITMARSAVVVRRCLVHRTRSTGISVFGSEGTVEATIVRGVLAQEADGLFGDGVASLMDLDLPGSLLLQRSIVEGSARAGVAVFGASLSLGGSRLTCNGFDLNFSPDMARGKFPAELTDSGSNTCGCEGAIVTCRAASASLQPTAAPPRP